MPGPITPLIDAPHPSDGWVILPEELRIAPQDGDLRRWQPQLDR